ncbi:MAG TPA: hypothetical protein VJJ82_01450 [Candidatus Nanoarchaeia archaeon]|nr:hypothetical protein [Candidatus Nanoarchaeia archaeon]
MPKILIGVVTHGKKRYCLDNLLTCLRGQSVPADILFVVNHGESAYATLLRSMNVNVVEDPKPATTRIEKILNGRNFIRDYALKNNYDALFFVNSDVMVPKLALEILLGLKTDIACGALLSAFSIDGKTVIAPVLYKDLGNGQCQLYKYEGAVVPQIIEIGAASLGCALVSRKVLDAVVFRTFEKSSTGGEDIAFFVDSRAKGFKTIAHTGVKCLHTPYPLTDPHAKLFQWKRGESTDFEVSLD